ncbi:DUF6732 family protein [Flavimaricola marinus]|uniref:Uncharacterized protein n=1 Tax=Flavimaricola marinus TaxID=1819565 RepID=A0A238LA70_9RHOB|nr:DUF6732 family protein [Flavimaricola marinus]SMY06501.1 hypothetical protein LOM8899_00626 [Flavimaricola marinus]
MRPVSLPPNLNLATTVAVAASGPAAAHPGHLAGLAGHDHWVAGAAIGAAILIGLWGAIKGKRKDEDVEDEAEDEQEQAA